MFNSRIINLRRPSAQRGRGNTLNKTQRIQSLPWVDGTDITKHENAQNKKDTMNTTLERSAVRRTDRKSVY